MRHGSLFSGIGGFDLAAEWMGWENVFHCEWNEFGQKVLHHYWPNADSLNDITKTDFTKYANKIDILTGGFPCQPYSSAGKRLGKEDERHLWPEMLRAIREIGPKYVVGENVFGLLSWNGGVVFDEVHSDLEAEGYEVQAVVIPAAAVNAPHGRDRVWFVATNTNGDGFNGCDKQNEIKPSKRRVDALGDAESLGRDASNTPSQRHRRGCNKSRTNQPKGRWEMGSYSEEHWHGVWCEIAGCCWFACNPTSERGKWVVARKQRKIGDPKQIKFRGGDCQSVIANTKRLGRGEIFENIQPKEPNGQFIKCDGGFGVTTNTNGNGFDQRNGNDEINPGQRGEHAFNDIEQVAMHTNSTMRKGQYIGQKREREFNRSNSRNGVNNFQNFPTQSPICGGDDGISYQLDGITFSKWRAESIKAYGNAIVPQVALQIFKAIIDTEK